MAEEFILGIARQSLETTLLVCLPVLLITLMIGVIISIFQAVTQIQEMTLTFVPKIVVTMLSLLLFGPWMMEKIVGFTREILQNIPFWIR
jgi:flagellar biosynthetic protein FliQ